MTIQDSRLTHTPPTNPTPTIILDTLAVSLIWDGVVIRVNTITTNIGINTNPIAITKSIEIAITEAISVVATTNTTETINTKASGDITVEGKLIARILSSSST